MARKELTIEQLNEKSLNALFKTKWINPHPSNVRYLRVLANLCKGVHKGRRGAHARLNTALMNGMPNHVVRAQMTPLAIAAMRSACARLAHCRNWDGEYDMWDMLIEDAANHLNIAKRINNGASPKAVDNLLWDMDTASREEMHPKVWRWIDESLAA